MSSAREEHAQRTHGRSEDIRAGHGIIRPARFVKSANEEQLHQAIIATSRFNAIA